MRNRKGRVTFVEMMVVVAIIAILVCLLAPAIKMAMDKRQEEQQGYGQVTEVQEQVNENPSIIIKCPHCGEELNINIGKGE